MKPIMISHVGRVRRKNEDACWSGHNNNFLVSVVADGMGGHNSGEIASAIIIDEFKKQISNLFETKGSVKDITSWLTKVIDTSNNEIIRRSLEKGNEGMGSTVVAAVVTKKNAIIANVGDSRAYAVKNDRVNIISKDHTLVQTMIESGMITSDEAQSHPNRNVLYQALGRTEIKGPYIRTFSKNAFNGILMCSDGLSDYLDEGQILDVLRQENYTIDEKLKVLTQIALDCGGKDNITIAYLDLGGVK